jgi:hypothetical protein
MLLDLWVIYGTLPCLITRKPEKSYSVVFFWSNCETQLVKNEIENSIPLS